MVAGPSTVAGVVPWLLTRWEVRHPVPGGMTARVLGALLVGGGAAVLTGVVMSALWLRCAAV